MSDETIKKIEKYLTFIYVTVKISVRDLYVLPAGHIDSLLKTAGVLLIITFLCKVFNLFVFLDFRGVLLAFLILIIIKIALRKQN